MQTKNCLKCGKPATNFTGHIHMDCGTVIAGWCGDHVGMMRNSHVKGCTHPAHRCYGYYPNHMIETTGEQSKQYLGYRNGELTVLNRDTDPEQ